ncbi:phycocyanin alpha subunit phycocyanobilin lyase, CpcE subunit [Calothrix sp. NIES-4071]|nr:phycocyanin alpha subunit phycocyanobilin lyase, CpcE subunit [Calothrix sp. NIES-4071]BAZ63331.1 phycocyanin alpha subunit phycocyanobilin lyase, CpcE subunit [Calothrix sp. NIES-4105]
MTLSSTIYEKYVEQLHSSNQDLVIESAHALGDLGDSRAVPILIKLLQESSDSAIRNAAAVGLREIGDERALYPIVSLINDPKTEGNRGTLIYALEGFECSHLLPFLVELVITGNFEVSHQAFSVIESIDMEIDLETADACIQKLKNALLQDDTKADLLEDLIDLLDEMRADA